MTGAPSPRPGAARAPGTPPGAAGGATVPPVRLDSRLLLGGAREVVIVHQGEEYRLRVTRHDKLILTK